MTKVDGGGRQRESPVGATTARAAEGRISTLRSYYALGERALGRSPDTSRLEPVTIDTLAVEAGVKADAIRKARDFARMYTRPEMESLTQLRNGRGLPLTWCHVRQLLPLTHRAERTELQSRAAAEGWSVRELRVQVQARLGGKKSSGAKTFAKPKTSEDALRRLIELSESWLRYYEEVVDVADTGLLVRLSEMPSDGPGREPLDPEGTAEKTLRELGRATGKVAGRLSKATARNKAATPEEPRVPEIEPTKAVPRKSPRSRGGG